MSIAFKGETLHASVSPCQACIGDKDNCALVKYVMALLNIPLLPGNPVLPLMPPFEYGKIEPMHDCDDIVQVICMRNFYYYQDGEEARLGPDDHQCGHAFITRNTKQLP